ncbi:MAG: hypothetical protein QXX68_02840 [Candidatus Pacearchaeota archaeon]
MDYIIGASVLVLILIIIFIIAAISGKKRRKNNKNYHAEQFKYSENSFQEKQQKDNEKLSELPVISINPVLKEVNQILDDCTTAYLSKNYEKAKELYNKAKEIYEKEGLKDTKTRNRFLSLFDGLKKV